MTWYIMDMIVALYEDVKKYYELDICLNPCKELSWQVGFAVMGVGVAVEAEIILKIGFFTFFSHLKPCMRLLCCTAPKL